MMLSMEDVTGLRAGGLQIGIDNGIGAVIIRMEGMPDGEPEIVLSCEMAVELSMKIIGAVARIRRYENGEPY
jgi:hypothetical protein